MQVPHLIHPVVPRDDNARKTGCTCNHRSSQKGNEHAFTCPLFIVRNTEPL
jgi:hypothetical protein